MNAPVSHRASPAFRDWLTGRLDPLEFEQSTSLTSDYDLSPDQRPIEIEPLTPASVLIGLIERDHGYSVLLTRRVDTMRRHAGQVAFPGGRRDPGETPWQAALREAQEEVGLDPSLVHLAGLSSPYQTGTGYLITPVVGFISAEHALVANPDEVADIFETPFDFLMDLSNHEEHEREMPTGEKRRFYAMTHNEQYIWGATAGMLRALRRRLYGDPNA